MAKVIISFDTENKECSVTVNGIEQKNVNYVCVSKYENEDAYLRMEMAEETGDGMKILTTALASEKGKNVVKKDDSLIEISSSDSLELGMKEFIK